MKNLLFISCLFLIGLLALTSCAKEESVATKEEVVEVFEARAPVSNTLFVANLRGDWPNCIPTRGTCDWLDGGCDVPWYDGIPAGLQFIEEEEDADVLMSIETYENENSIGFRMIGFSEVFLNNANENGDNGSVFSVSETIPLNPEATQLLGFENITIIEGEYPIHLDPETGNHLVYIEASLQ